VQAKQRWIPVRESWERLEWAVHGRTGEQSPLIIRSEGKRGMKVNQNRGSGAFMVKKHKKMGKVGRSYGGWGRVKGTMIDP